MTRFAYQHQVDLHFGNAASKFNNFWTGALPRNFVRKFLDFRGANRISKYGYAQSMTAGILCGARFAPR